MKKRIPIFSARILLLAVLPYLNACNVRTASDNLVIATDSSSIAAGQRIFAENCSACHNFKNDGIGPQLGGLTSVVTADWIRSFIKAPETIIESGDERAQALYEKYKTIMPSFSYYSDDQVNDLIAYLSTQKSPKKKKPDDPNALKNPLPEPIAMSDLVVD